jgi:muramidase (phage lysozyme)
MEKTIPPAAAVILDFIRKTEVGTADRSGYDVIYGHKQGKLPKPLTSMTLNEIQAAQRDWSRHHGSSAAGGYQFMRATLRDLMKELGLHGSQRLDPDLQDRLGFHLLRRRGYEAFLVGTISRTEFGKRLAQEWASFPVLAATKGAHRTVKRGQSFYVGDSLNKALVTPETVEAILDRALALAKRPPDRPQDTQEAPGPKDGPENQERPPAPVSAAGKGIIATVVVAILAGAGALASKWCEVIGLFCQ